MIIDFEFIELFKVCDADFGGYAYAEPKNYKFTSVSISIWVSFGDGGFSNKAFESHEYIEFCF